MNASNNNHRDSHTAGVAGLPPVAWRQALRRQLLAWFAAHARDLPWRRRTDAYAIWLSEIMLQQTTVAMARPHFERFLEAFPTLASLAKADEQEVLRLWEGLGYYRRAKQLHLAAKTIAAQHGGEFPRDVEAVRRLPGIGRYTAGAILSVAFDLRLPILETNTQRVWCRLLGFQGDPARAAGQQLLWAAAEAALPQRRPGAFNQALMELGSVVCLPRNPRCQECPVAVHCQARVQGLQDSIPPPKKRPIVEAVHEATVIVRRGNRVLLVQHAPGGRWADLWGFPRFPLPDDGSIMTPLDFSQQVCAITGMHVTEGVLLTTIKHAVTRYRVTLDCYEARYVGCNGKPNVTLPMKWLRRAEIDRYPLSTPARRLVVLV